MHGQMSISDYLSSIPDVVWVGCGPCICRKCLHYQSDRCEYGRCYDDRRASENPYDRAHPDEQPRTGWSHWDKPGEQAHWCRGGTCYPIYQCGRFEEYKEIKFESCIRCDVPVYQDGYKQCPLVESVGCGACYEFLMQKMEGKE